MTTHQGEAQERGKWVKVKPGKLWHYKVGEKIAGFVRHTFNGWDAYITTSKKWPDGHRWLGGSVFWKAKQSVVAEIEWMERVND